MNKLTYFKIKGKQPGLNVLILGGLHGDELTPYVILNSLRNFNIKKGELTVIPFINRVGLLLRKHGISDKIDNINRLFATKKISDIPINKLITEVKELINKSDIIIDLHTGRFTKTAPYGVIFNDDLSLVKKLGIKFVEKVNPELNKSRVKKTLSWYALSKAKKAIIIEMSNIANISETEIKRVTRNMTALNNNINFRTKNIHICKAFKLNFDLLVTKLNVNINAEVKKGEILFRGINLKNGKILEFRTKQSGIITTLPNKGVHLKGYNMYRIALK